MKNTLKNIFKWLALPKRRMLKIIFDTNFLLIPGSLKVDIFSEIDRIIDEPYELYVVDKTFQELNNIIENQKGKYKTYAKIALQLIKQKSIKVIDVKQKSLYMNPDFDEHIVDDILLEISDKNTIIATQDKELRKKLALKKIKTIILRNKKYVELL